VLSDNLLKHITDSPALKHIMNVTEINTEFVGAALIPMPGPLHSHMLRFPCLGLPA